MQTLGLFILRQQGLKSRSGGVCQKQAGNGLHPSYLVHTRASHLEPSSFLDKYLVLLFLRQQSSVFVVYGSNFDGRNKSLGRPSD